MEVGEDVTVREYFEEHVPRIFKEQVSQVSSSGMEGTDFSVQFDISGAEKHTYGIIVKDAKELEVKIEGDLPFAMALGNLVS